MSEKEKQMWIQKITKIIIATVSLIVLIISLWIMFDCFKKPQDQENFIVNYSSGATADYRVYLKPNKFYDQKSLGKGNKYVSNLIDYIDIDLGYSFKSTLISDSSFSYNVEAIISSDYELNGKSAELWSKKFVLYPTKTSSSNSTVTHNYKESIRISNYSQYETLAKRFREEYGIVADTKLTIVINVDATSNIKGNYNKNVKDSKKITLVMPLNKSVTDISVSGVGESSKNVTQTVKGEMHINYFLLIVSIILIVVSAPICIITFYKLFKITNVSQFILQLRKILKGYGDIIAEVTTKPDLKGLNIIEVKEFEDLINIEEELRVPILYYELEKDNEAWFIITTGNQVYRYILRASSHIKL